MRKLFCLILALAALCSAALAEPAAAEFSTTDMEGHPVTQEIFADYDLTVVNVWATWCGYCVEEMPCFSELKTMLPDNVNFITMCADATAERKLAGEILRASGANFQTLVVNEELEAQFLSQVYAYPTTLFLDRGGNAVRKPLVGVPSLTEPVEAYYGLITGALRMMEG